MQSAKKIKTSSLILDRSDEELSNEALWARLREGHQKAIEDLYRYNYQVLYSYAYKICRDKELSKDCVQDLFVNLWEKRVNLGPVTKVRPYLLQSIWHLLIRRLKAASKNLLLDENAHYDIDMVFSAEGAIVENQMQSDRSRELHMALEKLSKRQKQIIFMQYYEGLTIDEIQEITELKYQSIKNLTHRAMLVLRDFFKKS